MTDDDYPKACFDPGSEWHETQICTRYRARLELWIAIQEFKHDVRKVLRASRLVRLLNRVMT